MARRLIMQRLQRSERGLISSKPSFSSSEDTHSVSSSSASEQDPEGHSGNNLNILLAAAMMEEGGGRTARSRDGPFPPPVAHVMAGHGGPVDHPTPNDVLSGRGSMVNNHPGNIRYRELCNAVKAEYLSPETRKMHKSHISARIVRAVRGGDRPGRFLKRDGRTGRWHEVGDRVAFRKTGQALREKAPQFRAAGGRGEGGGPGGPVPAVPAAAHPPAAQQGRHPGPAPEAPSPAADAARVAADPAADNVAGVANVAAARPGAGVWRTPAPGSPAAAPGGPGRITSPEGGARTGSEP